MKNNFTQQLGNCFWEWLVSLWIKVQLPMWKLFNEFCLIPKTNARYALNLRVGEETKFHSNKWNLGRDLNARRLCLWYSQSYNSQDTTGWKCNLWNANANEVTDWYRCVRTFTILWILTRNRVTQYLWNKLNTDGRDIMKCIWKWNINGDISHH